MRKKIKKIPKYNGGTPKVIDPNVLNSSMAGRFTTPTLKNTNPQIASLSQHSRAIGSGGFGAGSSGGGKVGAGNVGSAISTGIGLLETATSGQDVTFANAAGSTLSGAATGLQMGGPVGAAVGAVVGLAAGTAGRKGSVDWENAEADYGSGWMKWFGPSKDEINEKVNIAENMILAKTDTERLRADYANRGYNPAPMVLVAEGGTIRQPVDALVSPGEIAINPYTLEYRQFGSDNEEPNSKDNIRTVLATDDNVKSHAKHMIMPNGKTPADNSKMVLDSNMPEERKRKMIKKIDNWESAHRTKPQQYAVYAEGTPEVVKLDEDPITDKLMAELMKPVVPKITGKSRKGLKFLNKMFDTASDYAPVLAALAKNTDYDVEQAYINPVKYLPTGVSIAPLKRSAEESLAIGRYNQARINPNTGAGMAYGLQAATNRAKALADAYAWQQDTQNKLIAQNVGIYNDWSAREAQARHTAAVETSQNAAAAQLMKDQAMKDAYEFKTGRRNDRWKLSMLEPLFNYAVDNNIWRNFKIV